MPVRVLAFVLAGGKGSRLFPLTRERAKPAVPFGGRYRIVDFVLSNPPYVAREEMDRLPPGVRDYEPHLALDGGPGGYALLDRLLAGAGACLEPGGHLIVEIGAPQEGPARQRFEGHSGYELADTIHDHSGHPRVLRARWRSRSRASSSRT